MFVILFSKNKNQGIKCDKYSIYFNLLQDYLLTKKKTGKYNLTKQQWKVVAKVGWDNNVWDAGN